MPAPIELFYWPTPNGKKIAIALHEMELPYTLNLVNIGKGDQFRADFLKISPNNRMPAIVDPDGPDGAPISVFESGAILQYLARKTGRFYGRDERERVQVEEWLYWQVGGVGPMAGLVFFKPLQMLLLLVFGVLLGLVGSLVSVGRHLREV